MNTLMQAAAVVSSVGVIGGGAYFLENRYAKIEMAGANAQAIALIRIENAHRAGQKETVRRLCDDFQKTHKWSPSLCR